MRLCTFLLSATVLVVAAAPLSAAAKPHLKAHHKTALRHAMAQKSAGIGVSMDEVRVITFEQPVATVFVGNPTIADATVIDPHHAFVLGKTFGVTNLVALGPQSQTVANRQISVANRAGGVVTLNKGAAQFNYACTLAHCEANPLPGDQKAFFDETTGSVASHQDQAVKAASVAATQH
ncbi:MAG: pilus assembly protein N-terminal domain-containing protein [Alphaproteobacteria bacterium]|nr:pilus assembly protein N-terminal domain-containing protein [Alphaproteobacteria bacterium]MBV9692151.1 pilus assembly protein N-terminal domain-containing protein [Alphaproteobacteria bacterium]